MNEENIVEEPLKGKTLVGYLAIAALVLGLAAFFSYHNTADKQEALSSYSGSVQQAYDELSETNSGTLRLFQASKNACQKIEDAKEQLKKHKLTSEDSGDSKVFCESIKYANDHMPASEPDGE